jgi:hypothetical protein
MSPASGGMNMQSFIDVMKSNVTYLLVARRRVATSGLAAGLEAVWTDIIVILWIVSNVSSHASDLWT